MRNHVGCNRQSRPPPNKYCENPLSSLIYNLSTSHASKGTASVCSYYLPTRNTYRIRTVSWQFSRFAKVCEGRGFSDFLSSRKSSFRLSRETRNVSSFERVHGLSFNTRVTVSTNFFYRLVERPSSVGTDKNEIQASRFHRVRQTRPQDLLFAFELCLFHNSTVYTG